MTAPRSTRFVAAHFVAALPVTALLVLAPVAAAAQDTNAPADGTGTAGLANPASQYCVSLGGTVKMRQTADGTVGDCHLPDGRVVEEWELYRADHE